MIRIAVAGAGVIGKRHIAALSDSRVAAADPIVDPDPAARDLARQLSIAWFADLAEMIARHRPDGVILATPNAMHVEGGLTCIAAGLPTLVEKPLATNLDQARRLVTAAEAAGVPLLTGHHRRHNPPIAAAKAVLEAGAIGTPVSVNALFWLFKPDDYFDVAWRREPRAGPVYLNLSHDLDLLRHLVGEIASVTAQDSSRVRGHPVEETAVILLRFVIGALGMVNASDTIPAPWSWEMTVGENAAYPRTDQACYLIGGTDGALELPQNRLWHYAGTKSWWEPLSSWVAATPTGDPLRR